MPTDCNLVYLPNLEYPTAVFLRNLKEPVNIWGTWSNVDPDSVGSGWALRVYIFDNPQGHGQVILIWSSHKLDISSSKAPNSQHLLGQVQVKVLEA